MDLIGILGEYLGEILIALISSGTTWFVARRRDTAETKVIEADAIANMQTVYDKFVADMKNRNEEIIKELDHLSEEVKELRHTVRTLEQDLEDCRKGIQKTTESVRTRKKAA
ncbi:MAG: hypothetical protein QG594_952 [Bacteroidota bacterium]|nr:hypothetical protein [Bacteroidota bacterium]